MANAALCSSACGVALLCHRASFGKECVRTAGVFIALVGLLTLSQFLTGLDLGIDDLVSWGAFGAFATVSPGRLRPPAALSFALLGLAFVLSTGRGRAQHWAATLGVVAASIASISLVGVLYAADELYALPRLTGIAPQTALMIAVTGIGLVVSIPDQGLMKALARNDNEAAVARRLLLPAVILPLTVGWIGRLGVTAGWYDAAFGLVIQAVSQIAVLVAPVWWVATSLNRREEQLEGARAAVRESNRMLGSITNNASTAILLMDAGQRCTYMNPAAEELTGFASEEVLARGVPLHELIGDRSFDRGGSTIRRASRAIADLASAAWRAVAYRRSRSGASSAAGTAVKVGGRTWPGPIGRAGGTAAHAEGPRVVAGRRGRPQVTGAASADGRGARAVPRLGRARVVGGLRGPACATREARVRRWVIRMATSEPPSFRYCCLHAVSTVQALCTPRQMTRGTASGSGGDHPTVSHDAAAAH